LFGVGRLRVGRGDERKGLEGCKNSTDEAVLLVCRLLAVVEVWESP
jgi:hypothetical protein